MEKNLKNISQKSIYMYIHIIHLYLHRTNDMKKANFILPLVASALVWMGLTSCGNSSKSDAATVNSDTTVQANANGKEFKVDTSACTVGFTGYGVGKDHPGEFRLKSGSLTAQDGKLTGGKFVINVASMKMGQTEDFITGKLRPHLLSPDFFDVEKFPEATFEITKVDAYTPTATDSSVVPGANQLISGNLTLKGVTKNISFPAKVETSEHGVNALANFNIDRTWWGMSYGNDKSLKDKFISEKVDLRISVAAKE